MPARACDRRTRCPGIIVVDSDGSLSANLAAMLESLECFVLACAGSGAEAMEMTCLLRPDLVLMDLGTADADGLETAKRIFARHPVPIIITTSDHSREMIRPADQTGVAGYLVKPFTVKELTAAVDMAFSRFPLLRSVHGGSNSLKESLRARCVIEKAKILLMERENLTEEEANNRIHHLSRNQNIALMRAAETIVCAGSASPAE